MNDLHRLVYMSRNLIDGDSDDLRGAIDQILAAARRNNPDVGVTGALLFNDVGFAQVLEGPRDAVQQVFEQIQVDERHDQVRILEWGPTSERTFERWSMAYAGPDSEAAERFADVMASSGFDATKMDGDHVLDILRSHMEPDRAARGDVAA